MTAEQVRSALMRRTPACSTPARLSTTTFPSTLQAVRRAVRRGIGGLVLRHVGFARSPGNPALCTKCLGKLRKYGMSRVEMPVTLLFSDVRGSTAMGEQMRQPSSAFLDHFYRLASEAIVRRDGLVDKVVGDEVVALFFGGISGPNRGSRHRGRDRRGRAGCWHRRDAVRACSSGNGGPHGEAFVGRTGPGGTIEDFTALGDVVNTTARLAATARAGEVIVGVAAAEAVDSDSVERRSRDPWPRGRSRGGGPPSRGLGALSGAPCSPRDCGSHNRAACFPGGYERGAAGSYRTCEPICPRSSAACGTTSAPCASTWPCPGRTRHGVRGTTWSPRWTTISSRGSRRWMRRRSSSSAARPGPGSRRF